jgi:hypothetical protein
MRTKVGIHGSNMMDGSISHSDFEALLARMTEGALSDPEREQLSVLLLSDSDLRRRYLEHCQMHALLQSEHGLLAAWSSYVSDADDVSNRVGHKRKSIVAGILLATAASLALAAGGVWWLRSEMPQQPLRGVEVAVLSKTVGAEFTFGPNGESSPAEGISLRQGTYELRKGLIELEYASGAILVMQAPAAFELVDDARVRLEDGQVAAHVPQAAIGFRIDSPGATVIDMGTDFAVQAVRDQESEVHVFQGEVLVDLHGDRGKSSDPLRLVTGEATRVNYRTGMPSGIDLDSQLFLRTLRENDSDYADAVQQLDPAVYYRMEPSSDGAQLIDSGPHAANAEICFGRAVSPVWTAGKVGAALELGGTALQMYAVAPSYPQAEQDELGVAGWVYARSRPRWASIAKNWAGGDFDRGQFHFGLNHDSGELEAHIVDSTGQEIVVLDSEPFPLRSWQHVAFVADGEKLRLYRNGREVDAQPYHKLHRDPRIKALAIGTKLNLIGTAPEERDYNMWDGRLDELAIFNHALSSEQIRKLYVMAGGSN